MVDVGWYTGASTCTDEEFDTLDRFFHKGHDYAKTKGEFIYHNFKEILAKDLETETSFEEQVLDSDLGHVQHGTPNWSSSEMDVTFISKL